MCTLPLIHMGSWALGLKSAYFCDTQKGSKGYVFLGENDDGTRTEIESRNANFLENEFPGIGETSKDIEFFEVEDEPIPTQEGEDPSVSGSGVDMDVLKPSSDTPELSVNESHEPRQSQRGKIPRRFHVIGGGMWPWWQLH